MTLTSGGFVCLQSELHSICIFRINQAEIELESAKSAYENLDILASIDHAKALVFNLEAWLLAENQKEKDHPTDCKDCELDQEDEDVNK